MDTQRSRNGRWPLRSMPTLVSCTPLWPSTMLLRAASPCLFWERLGPLMILVAAPGLTGSIPALIKPLSCAQCSNSTSNLTQSLLPLAPLCAATRPLHPSPVPRAPTYVCLDVCLQEDKHDASKL